MKTFFRFLTEAEETGPAAEARKRRLKSDGHGGWLDARGNYVAKTEGKKLRFLSKREAQDEGPVKQMAQRRADDNLAGAPLQKRQDPKRPAKAQEAPKTAKKGKKEEETSDKELSDALTVVFGRFNPPTAGHEKLLTQAKATAAGGDLKIYPSRTQDDKKNPIDVDMKVSYMRKMFKNFKDEIVNDSEMSTIFNVLIAASEEGYKNVNIVVGADRQSEFESLATKYNGDLYNFDDIRVVSAGPRDDSMDTIEGISASKQRKAVVDDDFEAFKKGVPSGMTDSDTQALFDAVRQGMKKKKSVKESYDLWEVAPKQDPRGLRENYRAGKIFNIGDLIESLNTGLIGRIMRKGTNYLIAVTESNVMFKSWIHDVMETKIKPASKTGIYGVPASQREVGTSSHRKYAQSMVPGQEEIKNFNIREFINRHRVK